MCCPAAPWQPLRPTWTAGGWDCEALDQLFYRILRARLDEEMGWSWQQLWNVVEAFVLNLQSPSRAHEVGKEHCDRGNDPLERMLDDCMVYSFGYWRRADTFDDAREAKPDLICQKLNLEPGMYVLDIGCGWGSFAQYAAEEYDVEIVGITISEEQVSLARERCAGLPVEIRIQDYREVKERFDRIVSIGVFEHVGHKNHRTYMEPTWRRCGGA